MKKRNYVSKISWVIKVKYKLRLYKTATREKNFVIQTSWNVSSIYKKVYSVDLANKIEPPREYFRVLHF